MAKQGLDSVADLILKDMFMQGKVLAIGKHIMSILKLCESFSSGKDADMFDTSVQRLVRLLTSEVSDGYGVWNTFLILLDYSKFYSISI
jgi:hypothetical protein